MRHWTRSKFALFFDVSIMTFSCVLLFLLLIYGTKGDSSVFISSITQTDGLDYAIETIEADGGYFQASTTSVGDGTISLMFSKLTLEGEWLWSTTYSLTDIDYIKPYSMIETSDGSIIITCEVYTEGVFKTVLFCIGTMSKGDVVWTHEIEDPIDDLHLGFTVEDANGNFIIASNLKVGSYRTILLTKIDSGGNKIWSKYWGETGSSEGQLFHMIMCKQCTSHSEDAILASVKSDDTHTTLLLIDVDSGDCLWARKYKNLAEFPSSARLKQTSDLQTLFITGTYFTNDQGIFVIKLNTSDFSSEIWSKKSHGNNEPFSGYYELYPNIEVTDDGGALITAYMSPGWQWLLKINSDGDEVYDYYRNPGVGSYNGLFGIHKTKDGNHLLVSGFYRGFSTLTKLNRFGEFTDCFSKSQVANNIIDDYAITITDSTELTRNRDSIFVSKNTLIYTLASQNFSSTIEARCNESCYGVNSYLESSCTVHGSCIGKDVCACINPDWYGDFCNQTDVLSNHTCNGLNWMNFTSCGVYGTCVDQDICQCDKLYFFDPISQICNVTKCDGVLSNLTEEVCSGHGNCILSTRTCSCPKNKYYGEGCEITQCYGVLSNDSAQCHASGSCVDFDVCQCFTPENYFGGNCNITSCKGIFSNRSESCGDHGLCKRYDECSCFPNYFAKDDQCNITTCYGVFSNDSDRVCGSHGFCKAYDVCQCDNREYFGKYCNTTVCFDILSNRTTKVCQGHGRCVSPNTCHCDSDYFGPGCNITTCQEILSNDTNNICSGHGSCLSFDNCTCVKNYSSSTCERYQCYGFYDNDEEKVCSGHGTCVSPDKCKCENLDYAGEKCNFWTCANISALEVDVVCGGGHGTCIDQDVCLCRSGYSSQSVEEPCDEWYCGSHFKNSKDVCNKRGSCVESHRCLCKDSYEGDLCETWSCGYDKDSSLACSGHGTCKSPEECECGNGYSGKQCGTNILYLTVMAPVLSIAGVMGVVFVCMLIFCLVGSFMCCLALFSCMVCVLCSATVSLNLRVKKFKQLKNFDILLKEQEMEEDESIAHIRIDRNLFEIPMDEIRLEMIIGEGGSASVVYLAKWKSQRIAFKCFKTRMVCSSQDSFDEFEREIAVLGSVNHPNVIQCFGCSLKPPRVGIVMEYCENGDLVDFLGGYHQKNLKKYPTKEKIRLCLETCRAMEYLHCRNIIHRDLKLENVLLDGKQTCKLMDFGLSKIVDRMSKKKTRQIGTSIYMAPEMVLSSGKYDEKIDVFSFGMMIFIILTENFKPFGMDQESGGNIEVKIATDPTYRPDVKKIRNGSSISWAETLMEQCWDHDSFNRPSFEDLVKIFDKRYNEFDETSKEEIGFDDSDDVGTTRKMVYEKKELGKVVDVEKVLEENERLKKRIQILEKKLNQKN